MKNYTPLVQNVLQGFSSGTYKTMADVARLTLQDWTNLVNQAGAPPGIDAAGQATPAEVFASVVYTRITRSYPTAALSSRITSGKFVPEALQRPLTTFFANNPSLELLTHNILAYLAAQPNALAGIAAESQAEVVASLRGFQRVLRVAPRPDVAETLLNLGFTSATQINAMGSQGFFDRATAGGLDQARGERGVRGRLAALRPGRVALHAAEPGLARAPAAGYRRPGRLRGRGTAGSPAGPHPYYLVRFAGLLRHRRLHVGPQPCRLLVRPAAMAPRTSARTADGARPPRQPAT